MGGQNHYGQPGLNGFEFLEEVESTGIGQFQIEQHEIGLRTFTFCLPCAAFGATSTAKPCLCSTAVSVACTVRSSSITMMVRVRLLMRSGLRLTFPEKPLEEYCFSSEIRELKLISTLPKLHWAF